MSFLHTTRNRICSVSAINLTNLDRRGRRSYLALVIRRFLSIDNNNRRRKRKEMSNALFVSLWWIREEVLVIVYHLSLVSSKSSWDRVQLDTRSNGIIPVWWTVLVKYKIAPLGHWPVSAQWWRWKSFDGCPQWNHKNQSKRSDKKPSPVLLVGHIIWSVDYSTTYDWSWGDKIISRGTWFTAASSPVPFQFVLRNWKP